MPRTAVTKKVYSFSCPVDLYDRAISVCNSRGCSKSWLVIQGLQRVLSEVEEDVADYEAAAAAWSEFEASGEKAIPADEARRLLGV